MQSPPVSDLFRMEEEVGRGSKEEDRPVLILVNPKSGTGHSAQLLRDQLEPLLRLHKIK